MVGLYISYLFYGGIFQMGASSVTGISGPGAVRGMAGPGNNRNFWVSQVSPHILAAGQSTAATVTLPVGDAALDLLPPNYAVIVTPLAGGAVTAVALKDAANNTSAWTGPLTSFTVSGPSSFMWEVVSIGYGVEAAASPNAATGWPDDRQAIVNAQASATLLPYG